ncbi:hypothetical protein CHS0354_021836 [Potamilus streckersoni]|uniref:Methyltransferase FkbM domain-containing protein n=1 Tax=Potamilus streckersoni TaxID=2493646 RepID=A0AAE0RQR0_9BIVA|nr:hypothetical protein CHS0354_021836 [Potamilus streckersoni]
MAKEPTLKTCFNVRRDPLDHFEQPQEAKIGVKKLEDTIQFEDSKRSTSASNLLTQLSERYEPVLFSSIRLRNTELTREKQNITTVCLENAVNDREKNGSLFWGKEDHIRTTHHTYLKKKDTVLIEIGGNIGDDATQFVKFYNPRYVIGEPLEDYVSILQEKFKNISRVTVINVGLGMKVEIAMVKTEGTNAIATSEFSGANGKRLLYLTNATKFLMNLGVGLFDVDLLTTNCKGCEYEVLETILSTNLINYIKNIQFAMHSTLQGLNDPLARYCKIQELLRRTHTPTYQYRLIWESWRRNSFCKLCTYLQGLSFTSGLTINIADHFTISVIEGMSH